MEATEGTIPGTETPAEVITPAEGTVPDIEATVVTPDDGDEGDPIDAAIEARARLLLKEREAEIEAQILARLTSQQEAARRATLDNQSRKTINESWTEAVKDARGKLQGVKYYTQTGQEATFTDDLVEELVVKPFQRHNAQVQQLATDQILELLGNEATTKVVPASVREKFAVEADGKPLDQWLRTVVEYAAPESAYVKAMKEAEDAKIKAAEARGYAKGQRAPAGTPRTAGAERVAAGQADLNTSTGIAQALRRGDITEDEARAAWRKLP